MTTKELSWDDYQSMERGDDTKPRFKQTKRPYSSMNSFLADSVCDRQSQNFFLPVVRYKSSLKGPEKSSYCGTFFFYEPDSNIYLNLGKTKIFGTKVHAFAYLMAERLYKIVNKKESTTWEQFESIYSNLIKNKDIGKQHLSLLKQTYLAPLQAWKCYDYFNLPDIKNKDLTQHAYDFYTFIPNDYNDYMNFYDTNIIMKYVEKKGEKKQLIACHDDLDQIICILARELNYDTIIIDREWGAFNVLTEIIDIRMSYEKTQTNYLCQVKDYKFLSGRDDSPYLWFKDKGTIVFNEREEPVRTPLDTTNFPMGTYPLIGAMYFPLGKLRANTLFDIPSIGKIASPDVTNFNFVDWFVIYNKLLFAYQNNAFFLRPEFNNLIKPISTRSGPTKVLKDLYLFGSETGKQLDPTQYLDEEHLDEDLMNDENLMNADDTED